MSVPPSPSEPIEPSSAPHLPGLPGWAPLQGSAPDPSWPPPEPWQRWTQGLDAPVPETAAPGTPAERIPSWPPRRSPGRRRHVLIAAVIAVSVLAAGAAGFALAVSLGGHGQIAADRPSPAARVGLPSGPQSGTPSPSQPAPAASLTPTSTPSPPAPAGTTVGLAAAAAANPAAPQVQALLGRYFTAINDHDYAQYSSLLDPQMQKDNPPSSFSTGYATTTDTAETITGISDTGDADLTVTVTFTSNQNPDNSPDNSSCTNWAITLYLVPQGGSYLIGPAPPTYTPSYQAC